MRKQFIILLFFLIFGGLVEDSSAQSVIVSPKIISITPNLISSLTDRGFPTEEFTLTGENLITGYRGEEINCGKDLKGPREYPNSFGVRIISWTDTVIKFKFTPDIFDLTYPDGVIKCRIGWDTYYDGFQYTGISSDTIALTPVITTAPSKVYQPGDKINITGSFMRNGVLTAKFNDIRIGTPYIINASGPQIFFSVLIPWNTTSGNLIVTTSDGYSSNPLYIKIKETPSCTSSDWSCSDWSTCSTGGKQTRTCNKTSNCQGGVTAPTISQPCTYVPVCTLYSWSCGSWSTCLSNGTKVRECSKISNCEGGTQSPATTQPCSYAPTCNADTWQCGSWGACSPQGIQTRSCSKTFDCPSVETAAPATSQYCVAPNQPKQQSPTEDLDIVNQSIIIKSTVKLLCPVSRTMASQGSGTVINSIGLILTNKHVIEGTAGCLVGFIDDYADEPYFGDRHIADIYKVSSDADIAVLKLRNPSNKLITSVNISQSNSSNIKLGEILTTYGYPAKFGTKITYTSGDFSGVDGNYLKTTAIIEHGNSGGGAYLKNGAFIGIPSAVVKGSLNSLGYLLSVNKVNSWLNNSVAYNYNNNDNNYSRVSALLEDIDLNTLDSLGLFLHGDEKNLKTQTEGQRVIAEEKLLTTKIDSNLSSRVSGVILLQVEKNGEGWYVYPDNKKKYYLGRPADAFSIMRNLGLGIKHSELSIYLNSKFPSRLSGKILLDVEQNGEAYYVNPKDLKGYYLNRPADAFKIMREFGLGITNTDIRKIDVGEIQ
jgi:S1-C subfamily serine protease